jgi:Fe2+ transport system protein FeoA
LEVLPFEGPLRLEIAGAEQVIGRSLAATVQVAS